MALTNIPLGEITEGHLRRLIAAQAAESLHVEYKRETYGSNDDQSASFSLTCHHSQTRRAAISWLSGLRLPIGERQHELLPQRNLATRRKRRLPKYPPRMRRSQVYTVDKQDVVHRHQKDREISGGATVEAEQQHVALSSPIRQRAEPLGPLRAIAYFRERFAMSPSVSNGSPPP